MAKTRRPYARDFREKMVALVRSGRSPAELSKEFEPTAQTIVNWARQADRDAGRRGDGLTSEDFGSHRPSVMYSVALRLSKTITI